MRFFFARTLFNSFIFTHIKQKKSSSVSRFQYFRGVRKWSIFTIVCSHALNWFRLRIFNLLVLLLSVTVVIYLHHLLSAFACRNIRMYTRLHDFDLFTFSYYVNVTGGTEKKNKRLQEAEPNLAECEMVLECRIEAASGLWKDLPWSGCLFVLVLYIRTPIRFPIMQQFYILSLH